MCLLTVRTSQGVLPVGEVVTSQGVLLPVGEVATSQGVLQWVRW